MTPGMQEAFYERRDEEMTVQYSRNIDYPAHFHECLELFYVRSGGSRVTVGEQSALMEAGDLALIFSNVIHSYLSRPQSEEASDSLLLIVPLSLTGEYRQTLAETAPENPFLPAGRLHPDVSYAFSSIAREEERNPRAERALVQLILSRTLPLLHLRKGAAEPTLVYQIVSQLPGAGDPRQPGAEAGDQPLHPLPYLFRKARLRLPRIPQPPALKRGGKPSAQHRPTDHRNQLSLWV